MTDLPSKVSLSLARTSLVNAELALANAVRNLHEAKRIGQMRRVAKVHVLVAREIHAIDKPVPPKRAESKQRAGWNADGTATDDDRFVLQKARIRHGNEYETEWLVYDRPNRRGPIAIHSTKRAAQQHVENKVAAEKLEKKGKKP